MVDECEVKVKVVCISGVWMSLGVFECKVLRIDA